MAESCANCALNLRLVKLDYSKGGCIHTPMEGYICLAFMRDGEADWMVGTDPENEMCEVYTEKEKKDV